MADSLFEECPDCFALCRGSKLDDHRTKAHHIPIDGHGTHLFRIGHVVNVIGNGQIDVMVPGAKHPILRAVACLNNPGGYVLNQKVVLAFAGVDLICLGVIS